MKFWASRHSSYLNTTRSSNIFSVCSPNMSPHTKTLTAFGQALFITYSMLFKGITHVLPLTLKTLQPASTVKCHRCFWVTYYEILKASRKRCAHVRIHPSGKQQHNSSILCSRQCSARPNKYTVLSISSLTGDLSHKIGGMFVWHGLCLGWSQKPTVLKKKPSYQ